MNQGMHVSDIGIDFFLNFADISNVGVGFLLLCEVERCIVSLILSLD
jgi:hypothetical protein